MTASGREPITDADGGAAAGIGWTDPAFGSIARWLYAEAGLVFSRARQAAVEGSLRRVMAASRLREPAALLAALERGGSVVDAVLAEITIGETYFFRERRQLDVVRALAFPDVVARDEPERPFRVWSAGCASGEEPYTLAIMLREACPGHQTRILGSDLASARLAAARRGRYTRWSFRGVPEDVVARYFTPERQHFVLDPAIRAAVDFRVINLAEDAYPAGEERMDLILCRNVLIYFDASTVQQVASRLLESLTDDGWLFLGASDPMIGNLVDCETVITDAGLAYRRPRPNADRYALRDASSSPAGAAGAWAPMQSFAPTGDGTVVADDSLGANVRMGGAPPAAPSVAPAPSTPAPDASRPRPAAAYAHEPLPSDAAAALAAYVAGDYDRSAELAARGAEAGSDETLAVVLVRSLANRGRLVEADAACARALETHPGSAELEYLRALLLDAAGQGAAATTAVRRALYLDRRSIVAHLLLGELLARAGDRTGSVRAFGNAESLLVALAPDALVPGSDGAPAARLLHIARSRAASVAKVAT